MSSINDCVFDEALQVESEQDAGVCTLPTVGHGYKGQLFAVTGCS